MEVAFPHVQHMKRFIWEAFPTPIMKALRFGTDVQMVLPLTSLFSPNLPIGHNRTPHQVLELTMTR